jgi:integrase
MSLRWSAVDLERRTITVLRTKNGRPQVSALSARAAEALRRLPHRNPDALVFECKAGRPYAFRRLWARVCTEAGLPGRNFHQLRHGCGHAMATAGVSQAQIMAVMGHRTLTASARYMHSNAADKINVVDRVFG